MTTLRVHEIDGTTPVVPRLRIQRATGGGDVSGIAPRLRIHRLSGAGAVPVRPRLRAHAVAGSGTASLVLAPLTNMSGVEPESKVQITASALTGLPDGWSWRQISGPAITLTATGPAVEFTAPSSMSTVTVVLGVTASSASVVSAERTVSIQVLPQTVWNYIGGTWRGAPAPVWL